MTSTPAGSYRSPDDLAVVTCYFNPAGFASKRRNYDAFARRLKRSGLHLTTIECSMGRAPFELPRARDVIRVRTASVLWQKERLLNIAIGALPRQFTKVAWLDADLLFTDVAWGAKASAALDEFPVIQPYAESIRLPPRATRFDGRGLVEDGFCFRITRSPHACTTGSWDVHGQTGFAWAARREVLDHGLYDRAIAGGGDHFMAHAFAGDWESACLTDVFLGNRSYEEDYRTWSARVYRRVRSRLRCLDGQVLHLWHGSLANRRYRDRALDLTALAYDPERDICIGKSGCWEWTGRNVALEAWCRRYFDERREDTRATAQVDHPSRRALLDRIRRYRHRSENADLSFWTKAAIAAERDVARASSAREARRVAQEFFDWCADGVNS